jgi:hypothetical protein
LIIEALTKIAVEGGEVFFPCSDEKTQDSIRAQAFYYRKRMPREIADKVGIQKLEEDGMKFVRIFKREETPLWVRDASGKLIPMPVTEVDAELQRIITLMRAEGKPESEISEVVLNWNQ